MPRPGTQIRIIDGAGPGGPRLATGTAFFIGFTERGPTTAVLVTSPRDYAIQLRRPQRRTRDLRLGAGLLRRGRRRAVRRTHERPRRRTASGTPGDWDLDAASPGAWANGVTVTADAVDGGVRLLIEDDDVLVESPTFAAVADGAGGRRRATSPWRSPAAAPTCPPTPPPPRWRAAPTTTPSTRTPSTPRWACSSRASAPASSSRPGWPTRWCGRSWPPTPSAPSAPRCSTSPTAPTPI